MKRRKTKQPPPTCLPPNYIWDCKEGKPKKLKSRTFTGKTCCCVGETETKNKKKRQKRTIVQSSVCYKKNVAWRGWDRMRLRPYHWWDWLIWILGEGSDRQDRVEIKNGQHDTHRVMFLLCFFWGVFFWFFFVQHAIWMTEHVIETVYSLKDVCTQSTGTQNKRARGHICTNTQHFRSFLQQIRRAEKDLVWSLWSY